MCGSASDVLPATGAPDISLVAMMMCDAGPPEGWVSAALLWRICSSDVQAVRTLDGIVWVLSAGTGE